MERKGMICPVCHRHRFSRYDSFEYCPICGWQDDAFQAIYPDEWAGANRGGLNKFIKELDAHLRSRGKTLEDFGDEIKD